LTTTSIGKQAAFVTNTGQIVKPDGTPNLQFNHTVVNHLFVVVYHRNHLGIISANPAVNVSGVYTYDFTTGMNQALGGAAAHKQLATGKWGMRGGDGNGDGIVNILDKSAVWSLSGQTGKSGYLPSDYNMNRQTNNCDKNDFWKINIGFISTLPE